MKFRHVLYILIGIAAISLVSSYVSEKPEPHSPNRINLPHTLEVHPGSGHGFGFGVVYTIAAHRKYDGKTYVVIKSTEPDVEIWSPNPLLVIKKDGYRFRLTEGTKFDESLHSVSTENR